MRVLSIGSDRKLFERDSAVADRARAYGARFGNLDIIVFSLKGHGLQKIELAPGVHVHPTQSISKLFYIWDAVKIGMTLSLPDVITTQDPFESGLAGMRLSKKLQVPLHVQLHTDPTAPQFSKSSFLNRIRIQIAPDVLRHASRIRTVAQKVADAIVQVYSLKVPVTALPIYVDTMRFANATVSEELTNRFAQFSKKILFVGRLEKEKNPCLALRAFAASAPKDSCLIIMGEGSERNLLGQLARELNVESRVFFEGFRDPAPYYKLADLLLVTSRYEGYGLTIVEALAAGTPVLATDVGVAREAGAIIADANNFAQMLSEWFANGPREGRLQLKLPVSKEAYVQVYCEDIEATASN